MISYRNVFLESSLGDKILNNISFDVQKGEFFVIVGPSGSGKTTTLKLINRLIEQTEGDIFFKIRK